MRVKELTRRRKKQETLPCNTLFEGRSGSYSYLIDFGTQVGSAGINYNAYAKPDKFTLEWNGEKVSTGYVGESQHNAELEAALGTEQYNQEEINTTPEGSGVGQLFINKTSAYPTTVLITVNAPIPINTGWDVQGICIQ